MTSDFKEFKLETTQSSTSSTWDQQNAVASNADFLATIDNSSPDGSNMNADLQLAIALQQHEFGQEQQQQQQPQRNSTSGGSRLITGPQDLFHLEAADSYLRFREAAPRQLHRVRGKAKNRKISLQIVNSCKTFWQGLR